MGALPSYHLLVLLVMIFLSHADSVMSCLESERQVLLVFKGALIDESNRLNSWVDVGGGSCCDWYGVSCNNSTGHVVGLHLQLDEYDPDLDLSYEVYNRTRLRGTISPSLLQLKQLVHLNLSWNDFWGAQIPPFTGSLSHFLCYQMNQTKQMEALNLANNFLSGEIPDCWMPWNSLTTLRMNNNNFTGRIPSSMENLRFLESLHLRNNNLQDGLPLLLRSCEYLSIVDLAENHLQGEIPPWIGKSNLTILDLRSNGFHGKLPQEICALATLQVIDLANNNLSGPIPRCINQLSSMTTNDSTGSQISKTTPSLHVGGYLEDAILVIQGRVMEYNTTLNLVRVVDFSNNSLTGKIPDEVTALTALQSLNLSQNTLSGEIPQNIGAMRLLESLDLSLNRLVGEIPSSISSLTFINHLNLSSNNLTGRIPTSTQLQSFNASCFAGNELCGSPLAKSCDENETPPLPTDTHGGTLATLLDDKWFFVSTAFGFVIGFWGFLFHLFYNRQWRIAFFSFLDRSGIFVCELVSRYM